MFKFLRSGASKEPASYEVTARLEQARALSRQGQLSEAAAMCTTVLELQAGHIDALMLSAEIAARQGDPERAIQLYSNVMRLQPKYGMAYYKRGNVLKDAVSCKPPSRATIGPWRSIRAMPTPSVIVVPSSSE